MSYKKSIVLLFTLFTCAVYGQKIVRLDGSRITGTQIDKVVKRLMDTAKVQGLSLALLNGNNVVYTKSYGYRNQPKNLLLDTSTIMYGASFSKAVFAYLVMKLVEEGQIDLDRPLYLYLKKPIPEYEYFGDLAADDRWRSVTARMCLSHTTGLPNVRWFHPETGQMDSLGVLRFYFTPGQQYAYSGEGFKLLQLVIEEIMQKNVDALAVERIFNPLGMHRTGFIWHSSFGDDNVAVGHLNSGLIDEKRKRTEPVAGGSLVTTISDYARFVSAVMQQKGLSSASYRAMLGAQVAIHSVTQFPPITKAVTTENDPIHLSYGLGWGLFTCEYGRAFFKEGNGDSWRNYNINYLDKGISLILLTNSENGESIFQELAQELLADRCIPWKWQGYIPYNATPQ